MRSALLSVAVSALLGASSGLSAQEVTLDEGTFTIFEGTTEVGTETFSIRRSGSGAEERIVAGARIHIVGGSQPRDVQTTLELRGPERRLVLYSAKIGGTEAQDVRYTEDGPARLSMVRRTDVGERARELRSPEGLTVLDTGVFHHLFFVVGRLSDTTVDVPVLVPVTGRTGTVSVRRHGPEEVDVGGSRVASQRLEVSSPTGGTLTVWVDEGGRVLAAQRVADQGVEFRAVRADLP